MIDCNPRMCGGLNGRYSHQYVDSTHWPGHDTEYDAVSNCSAMKTCCMVVHIP